MPTSFSIGTCSLAALPGARIEACSAARTLLLRSDTANVAAARPPPLHFLRGSASFAAWVPEPEARARSAGPGAIDRNAHDPAFLSSSRKSSAIRAPGAGAARLAPVRKVRPRAGGRPIDVRVRRPGRHALRRCRRRHFRDRGLGIDVQRTISALTQGRPHQTITNQTMLLADAVAFDGRGGCVMFSVRYEPRFLEYGSLAGTIARPARVRKNTITRCRRCRARRRSPPSSARASCWNTGDGPRDVNDPRRG